jgi:pilus assembly protein CpaC
MGLLAALLALPGASASFAAPALAGGPPAYAPVRAPAPILGDTTLRVALSTSGPASRSLQIGKGKSAIVELPVDARDVAVTTPAVADVVLHTPRRISIQGVATGQTDATFFDGMGRTILSLDIRVDQDGSAAAQTIARVLPASKIEVQAVNNSLILTGEVASASDSDKAQRIAEQFVEKPERVLNMLSIAGKQQVMLKVRVVEVQRTAIKQLGFNLNAIIGQMGGNQITSAFVPGWGVNGQVLGGLTQGLARDTTTQPLLASPDGCTSTTTIDRTHKADCVGVGRAGSTGVNQAAATVQAFERVGLVRTLAEPNLTAVSGEAAKFLVGGEFPVPTGQDSQGRVTIEFKPFGVGLGFTPVVLSDGRISLKLSTEVSSLTNQGSFTINNGSGAPSLTIPALSVRRAETTVELPSGGALMIAGLLQDDTKQTLDSLPGAMNLPVLGTLLRSRDFQSGQTELVVIVTPYLVKPVSPDSLQTPADGLKIASDAQTVLLGRLNRAYKAPPAAVAGRTYEGPYGYVIE